MNIAEIPKRLVLVLMCQLAGCAYCILALGAMVKVRKLGVPASHLRIDDYLPWVKNLGWLLFLLPCAWFSLHVRSWWVRGADWSLLRNVVLSGVASFLVIVILAFWATCLGMGVMRI